MAYFSLCVLVSVLATVFLLTYLWALEKTKIASVSIIRSFGSLFSQDKKAYFKSGIIFHLACGFFFGLLYIFLFRILPIPGWGRYTFMYGVVGMGMGFNHGMLDALVLSILLPKHHPIDSYKKAGLETAILHGIGLIPYGLVIGILFKIFLAENL